MTDKHELAFPSSGAYNKGLTIRQYYTAAALQGILANFYCELTPDEVAIEALRYANALIKAESEIK